MFKLLKHFHDDYLIKWAYILLIILLGLALRTYSLSTNPLGFYADEASIGYNAYCIAETLRDEHNQFLPLYFRAFNEYKDPVPIYLTAIFIKILGPTVFAVRFMPAVCGTLTIFIVYLIVQIYFFRGIALLAALLTAISPWMISFSRSVGNLSPYVLFFILGFYFTSLAVKHTKGKYIFYSIIPTALAFYTYGIAKCFIPLFYFFFFFFNFKKLWNLKLPMIISVLIVIIMLIPAGTAFMKPEIRMRSDLLNITNDYYSVSKGRTKYKEQGHHFIANNNYLLLPAMFLENYFKHLSFDFLLKEGDRNLRHNIQGRGQLLWFTFYMLILGLLCILRTKKKELQIFPAWFFLFPIPASLTWEGLPHAPRTCSGCPVFEILAAVGFSYLLTWTKASFYSSRSIILTTIVVMVLAHGILDFKSYTIEYFTDYPKKTSHAFDYDFYAIQKTGQEYSEYDYFQLSYKFAGFPYVTFLFLDKVKPQEWLKDKSVLRFRKDYSFEREPVYELIANYNNKKVARICQPGTYEAERKIGEVRHELSNDLLFEIKEYNPNSPTAWVE